MRYKFSLFLEPFEIKSQKRKQNKHTKQNNENKKRKEQNQSG